MPAPATLVRSAIPLVILLSGCAVTTGARHPVAKEEAERIAVAYMAQRTGKEWHATTASVQHENGEEFWSVDVVAGKASPAGGLILEVAGYNAFDVDVGLNSGAVLTKHVHVYL